MKQIGRNVEESPIPQVQYVVKSFYLLLQKAVDLRNSALPSRAHGVPWIRKNGYPSSQENLVVT